MSDFLLKYKYKYRCARPTMILADGQLQPATPCDAVYLLIPVPPMSGPKSYSRLITIA